VVLVLACVFPVAGDEKPVEAFTRASYNVQLAFTFPGKVKSVPVSPGDKVKKGDLLIQLEDDETRAMVKLWTMRARSNVAVLVAEAALKMAQWEQEKLEQLERTDAGSKLELKRARIQVNIETERANQAREQKAEALQELARYTAQHKRFIMRAPADAVVEAIDIEEGEVAEQSKPVIALVAIDPLWIDAPIPTPQTLSLKVGDPVWVRSELPGYKHPVKGHIKHMRQVADASSRTRLVRLEIPNPSVLPAGVKVKVSFKAPGKEVAKVHKNELLPDG